jgi:hypothetical protein
MEKKMMNNGLATAIVAHAIGLSVPHRHPLFFVKTAIFFIIIPEKEKPVTNN